MKIGVISDTHGNLPDEALRRLEGVGHILHAGDVGEGVLEALRTHGCPVTAGLGNTDDPASGLPLEARLALAGVTVGMRHIQSPPGRLALRQVEEVAASGIRVLVFGHTHQPLCEERGGVLYINPGSAGQPRFGLGASMGYLWLGEGEPRFELVELSGSS